MAAHSILNYRAHIWKLLIECALFVGEDFDSGLCFSLIDTHWLVAEVDEEEGEVCRLVNKLTVDEGHAFDQAFTLGARFDHTITIHIFGETENYINIGVARIIEVLQIHCHLRIDLQERECWHAELHQDVIDGDILSYILTVSIKQLAIQSQNFSVDPEEVCLRPWICTIRTVRSVLELPELLAEHLDLHLKFVEL